MKENFNSTKAIAQRYTCETHAINKELKIK